MSNDKIAKINVIRDMKQPVFVDKSPEFPKAEAARNDFYPRAAPATWQEVKEKWVNGNNKPKEIVDQWAASLGFAEKSLIGTPPTRMLGRFGKIVPAVPMIAVGGAA